MHKPESIQEIQMLKVLSDFEIPTAHIISAKRPDLMLTDKKNKIVV